MPSRATLDTIAGWTVRPSEARTPGASRVLAEPRVVNVARPRNGYGAVSYGTSPSGGAASLAPMIQPRDIRPAEWTMFVHMAADNDLSLFGRDDIIEMEKIGSIPGRVNVIALVDPGDVGGNNPLDWPNRSRLLYIEKNPQGGDQIRSRELAIDPRSELGQLIAASHGRLDMGDPAVLRAAVEYVQRNVPSRRFFLDLWNHGSAWRGIAWDDSSGDHLSFAAGGLERALEGLKIDALGADACLTATAEVALLAQKLGISMLVGSPEVEPGSGWNYADALARLVRLAGECDEITPFAFAGELVESYAADKNPVISATCLDRHFGEFREAFDQFSRTCVAAGGLSGNAALRNIYEKSFRYRHDQMDLGDFLRRVAISFEEGPLVRSASNALMTLSGMTLAMHGDATYNRTSGLSVYAPGAQLANVDPEYLGATTPWSDLEWTRFVRTLLPPAAPQGPPPAWARLRADGPRRPVGPPPSRPGERPTDVTALSDAPPGQYDWFYNLNGGAVRSVRMALGPDAVIEGEVRSGPVELYATAARDDANRRVVIDLTAFRRSDLAEADRPHTFNVHVPLPVGSGEEGNWEIVVNGTHWESGMELGRTTWRNGRPLGAPP